MIVKNSEFTISAVSPKQYPSDELPEIVLVGKSNVGKSSFINTLINRKNLARTSSEPGKTRLINFYKVTYAPDKDADNKQFYFVDLPGYGYSKMSHTQQVEVGKFIEQYLVKSSKIRLVVLLIDIRHDPTSDDKMMYDYIIKNNVPCIIVANKADKIAVTKVDAQVESLQQILNPLKDLNFIPFSCERKIYSDKVYEILDDVLK